MRRAGWFQPPRTVSLDSPQLLPNSLGPGQEHASSQDPRLPSRGGGAAQEEGWVFSSILAAPEQSCVPQGDPLRELSSGIGGWDTPRPATPINTWAGHSCGSLGESDCRITHFPSPDTDAYAV